MAANPDDTTIAELRAELDSLRAEVASLADAPAADATSRRNLLRMGGAAAVAGIAGMAAMSSPADAVTGDPVKQGNTNDSSTGPGTFLTGDPTDGTTLFLGNKSFGAPLNIEPKDGAGVSVGGTLSYTRKTITGPPTGSQQGAHSKGDIFLDSRAKPYVCIASGLPGTWVALGFNPVPTARLADTRPGNPSAGELGSTKLGGSAGGQNPDGTIRTAQVTGKLGVAVGATAVVCNITSLNLTNASQVSFLTVYAADQAKPVASTLNVGPGQTVANGAIIPLSADGKIDVYNFVGLVDVIIDVSGFFY